MRRHGWAGVIMGSMAAVAASAGEAFVPPAVPWGRIAAADGGLQLVVERLPADGRIPMPRLHNPIGSLRLQGDAAGAPLALQPGVAEWTVAVPRGTTAPLTIAVEVVGSPRLVGAEPPVVEPAADGALTLRAHDALPQGRMLRYEPQPAKDTLGYWVDAGDRAQWRLRVAAPGGYRVLLLQGCGSGNGGSVVQVAVGEQRLDYTVEDTGGFQRFVERPAGVLRLEAGLHTLEVRAVRKAKAAVMDLRQVRLLPE